MVSLDPRVFLRSLFDAAVTAADPRLAMKANLPPKPKGRTVVIGVGKASAQMAAILEDLWDGPLTGAVVTRYGFGCRTRTVEVLEASHPIPDEAGLLASAVLFKLVGDLTPDDLVIALVSGGGSALLPAPPAPMSLIDEVEVCKTLLTSGAPISAMNVVRKHLSTIKGGRLAASTKAPVVTFVVSDVPGDDPALVASGPTIPDMTTPEDALLVVEQYGLRLPQSAMMHLISGLAAAPRPTDPVFNGHRHHIVASSRISLDAAARAARDVGILPVILSDAIEGEARHIATMHTAIAREVVSQNQPFQKPVVILSGGETTVTVLAEGGRGGRNTEFALAAAVGLQGLDVDLLAADTDGIDGSGTNAGAFVDGSTIRRLSLAGVDALEVLRRNDSYGAFLAIDDLFAPGPTGTNVNDFRAIYIR